MRFVIEIPDELVLSTSSAASAAPGTGPAGAFDSTAADSATVEIHSGGAAPDTARTGSLSPAAGTHDVLPAGPAEHGGEYASQGAGSASEQESDRTSSPESPQNGGAGPA